MGRHHDDGTKITIESVKNRLSKDSYGPEVVDTIKFLVSEVDRLETELKNKTEFLGTSLTIFEETLQKAVDFLLAQNYNH